jgi:hypothetical protein
MRSYGRAYDFVQDGMPQVQRVCEVEAVSSTGGRVLGRDCGGGEGEEEEADGVGVASWGLETAAAGSLVLMDTFGRAVGYGAARTVFLDNVSPLAVTDVRLRGRLAWQSGNVGGVGVL